MKPNPLALRSKPRSICQVCGFLLKQPARPRRLFGVAVQGPSLQALYPQPYSPRRHLFSASTKPPPKPHLDSATAADSGPDNNDIGRLPPDPSAALAKAEQSVNSILNSPGIPSEGAALEALQACEAAARLLIDETEASSQPSREDTSPASALLNLNERSNTSPSPLGNIVIDGLSSLAYSLLLYPPVFITPKILESYIRTQCLLTRPSSFPEIFTLYTTKPAPVPGTSPPRYKSPNPNSASVAIPTDIANAALESAITVHDLPLALSLIETTFRTPSYRRSKFLTRALPPLGGLAVTPLAAYALATQFSLYQQTMDPASATKLALAGILAYLGGTATIGVVAVTTANDQMDRVTWATGMPLRERWMREEERAAVDRVAGAWGFREREKRGEEEGEEWEALREWIGLRGMVLDRVELMEGME